jgi:hypothetical protein
MYCPNCGSQNTAGIKFCRHCGTNLSAVSDAVLNKSDNPSLAELIKSYYSGRHQLMLGALQIAAGVALLGIIWAAGLWNFFWIFFWLFLTLFGNGARQFNKGWNRWSEASSGLKSLGYDKPPVKDRAATGSLPLREAEPALPASEHDRYTPSVTESTTRRLDSPE